jgi:putative transcriptional regulator
MGHGLFDIPMNCISFHRFVHPSYNEVDKMGAYDFKKRTKFGKWVNQNRLSQEQVMKLTGKDKNTISKMCNDFDYEPQEVTQLKVISGLRKHGYDVRVRDFW